MLLNSFLVLLCTDSENSLFQQCFSITFKNTSCETPMTTNSFPRLLDHLGQSIVDLFFVVEKGVTWIEFLRGYIKCCRRAASSASLNNLFRVFDAMALKAGLPEKLQFEPDENDGKMSGFLMPADVLILLWMCWIMVWDSKCSKSVERNENYDLPDVGPLVLSAVLSCAEVGSDMNAYDCDISGLDVQLPAGKIHLWALKTVPSLADCFSQFVHSRLHSSLTSKVSPLTSKVLQLRPSLLMYRLHKFAY